jgi:Lrp/AsnC family leucine-responsive transcriptional regulator
MEKKGIIRGYSADIDPAKVGLGALAFIFIRTEKRIEDTAKILGDIPEALEVHHIAGEDCYILKVYVRDTKALGELLEKKLNMIQSVKSTRTTIVLSTIKEGHRLPIEEV